MASFREITDPAEVAAIFGSAPISGAMPSRARGPEQVGGGVRELPPPPRPTPNFAPIMTGTGLAAGMAY